MSFSLLVTAILPVPSPLLLITLVLDFKKFAKMLVLKRVELYHICFSKMETYRKKCNIENLTQIQFIVV